jgi:carboxynorspermidine decarboxylase
MAEIISAIRNLRLAIGELPVRILYSVKACALWPLLEVIANKVDGFSVASPGEANLIKGLTESARHVQITSPGLTAELLTELEVVSHVTFNSISQCDRLSKQIDPSIALGVRVNPGWSNIEDERYDPCRRHSKLGVSPSELNEWSKIPKRISGLHVHNACLSESWNPLLKTVDGLVETLGPLLGRLSWINLGGGYLWTLETDFDPLRQAVRKLSALGLGVILEPGAGFVNSAGRLVASVVDLFRRNGRVIAVLDTSVNHLPEVFEYQFEPDVAQHIEGGRHKYILAGCSCLAGDVFGEYAFNEALEIGSRITFENVGAYTMVKATMFNGINLPSIYILDEAGDLRLIREFTFEDFASRCGAPINDYANF